jgi:hypothetical protein
VAWPGLLCCLLCCLGVGLAASVSPAQAGPVAHPTTVSADPADFTPQVGGGGAVYALAQRGDTLYAGGDFQQVAGAQRQTFHNRSNLVSFDATDGTISDLSPRVDGAVWALQTTARALYVGGDFARVNGIARRGIAKLDPVTGAVDPAFDAHLLGNVTEIRMVGTRLIVGGSFPRQLLALDPATGATTDYIGAAIAGSLGPDAGRTRIYRFAVDPAGTRLVAVGNFETVDGVPRSRAFMLDLGRTRASLNRWYYQPLRRMCRAVNKPDYLRDVDFSPDGRYFVLVSTGFLPERGGVGRDICDAAARFETRIAHPRRPTWVNYTGGDTLHSVAATGAAVYVQGHNRRVDSPGFARGVRVTNAAVARAGIAALDPATGRALSWNPGKTRAVGGKDLLATRAGLWVGSDGSRFAGEVHSGIAFCPLG